MKSTSGFAHRLNENGTIDSICLDCFITVASADSVERLIEREEQHQCDHLTKSVDDKRPQDQERIIKWPKSA